MYEGGPVPVVPPSTIAEIPKKQREKAERLMHERAVLGYAFSYQKLVENITEVVARASEDDFINSSHRDEAIKQCIQDSIEAYSEDDCKSAKNRLNEKLCALFAENGIKTLRDTDPFGRQKDYILMESASTSCPRDRVIEIAVSKYGIPAKKLAQAFADATVKTPFTTLQARDVKEEPKEAA
jgi:hypothetical protein